MDNFWDCWKQENYLCYIDFYELRIDQYFDSHKLKG